MTCPTGYLCQSQHDPLIGYCCKGTAVATTSDGCPPGEVVYMERNEVVACDPFNPQNQGCPTGFTCQWSVRSQRYQCCGSDPLPTQSESKFSAIFLKDTNLGGNDGCPAKQIAYMDSTTKKPKVCTSATFSCPIGYFCQFSNSNKQFQCCGITSECPAGQVVFSEVSWETYLGCLYQHQR